ncbi:MAG: HlyD family efflux transporter periplasmic adaptor subunit [Verrucomicrobiales bacterium]|nr:HlyD family efflux transporter periplasmic adaptor subunit [Verrucomicrobiales bacterium]
MDIPRPDRARALRRRRWWTGGAVVAGLILVTAVVLRIEPAAPLVEVPVWTDTVKRGELLRQVRGPGSLVPELIQYVQSETEGRVERILVQPGTEVFPETILLELSNPELRQSSFDAEWALKAAEAQALRLRANLEADRLAQMAALATLKAEFTQANLEAEADDTLAKDGLVPEITRRKSRSNADNLKARVEIEGRRLDFAASSASAQLAVQEAEVEKLKASLELKRRQVANLQVRAGIAGVLQQTGDREPLQVGQRISPSATLAKVVMPTQLRADIRIAETQARDILRGQVASIDTRNGIVPGRVQRVDPAVQNGTVLVEVKLEGELPRGARPDLSVEGTIELERLTNVLYVGKPTQGQEDGTAGLFKVSPGGREAVRVPVRFGRSSVSSIEIREGLQPGDLVVLSDMSQWDSHTKVRLR